MKIYISQREAARIKGVTPLTIFKNKGNFTMYNSKILTDDKFEAWQPKRKRKPA